MSALIAIETVGIGVMAVDAFEVGGLKRRAMWHSLNRSNSEYSRVDCNGVARPGLKIATVFRQTGLKCGRVRPAGRDHPMIAMAAARRSGSD